MPNKKTYLWSELILLFVVVPILLTISIPLFLKIALTLTGIVYCIIIFKKTNLLSIKSLYKIESKKRWKNIVITFTTIATVTSLYVYFTNPTLLFLVVKKTPLIWLLVILFYSIFSTYPQELLYRSYFFARYQELFSKPIYLIIINSIVFSLGHLFFKNELVLLVTLVGGILFSFTYYKSKSLMLTSIEHSLYGSWLFTIGMGEMLAFPMPH